MSDAARVRFGVFVPQGWKLEYTGWSASDAWARSVELARQAEALGYDHLWVYDHVETVPRREPTHMFEAFTMLAALAQHTSRIRLGQLVTCVGYRNVGLLAKEAACVDVYSGGRLILGLGAGWYRREYEAYGVTYLADRDRLAHLDEALTVIPRLWSEETVDFAGRHVRLDGAYCDPKPVQTRPPILVGGGGERVTLRLAARHADLTNWQVGLESFVHKSALLEDYCAEIGRSFDDITRTHGPDCRIFDTDAAARAWCRARPAVATCGVVATPTRTCGTISSAPSTRSWRRRRASSTPAAGSSSCGCAMRQRTPRSRDSRPR